MPVPILLRTENGRLRSEKSRSKCRDRYSGTSFYNVPSSVHPTSCLVYGSTNFTVPKGACINARLYALLNVAVNITTVSILIRKAARNTASGDCLVVFENSRKFCLLGATLMIMIPVFYWR